MKTLFKSWIVRAFTLLFVASAAFAQDRVPFRQEELDQMLAPIALYPDSLLSQMLMASTYPLEVVQAARWSRANPGVGGQNAVNAVERMDWDPSVKSLTAFPQVLSMMDQKLEWTERLGEAFLAQQEDVMSSVQGLRQRAEAAGNLRSNDQMRVVRQGEAIAIEPPAPEVVYVPYYSPAVVYGPWLWPAYPPVYWGPFPGYYARPAYAPGFFWGSGIVISTGFFFGHFDWPHRHVKVVHVHHNQHARPTPVHSNWRHDPAHRRGVPFRNVDARKRFEQSRAADARRDTDRRDAVRVAGRNDDRRTADIRQRRVEERRNSPQGRREDGRDDRRESAVSRFPQSNDGNRPANRNDERLRSPARPETRGAQPDRGVQPERPSPRPGDRSQERRDAPRAPSGGADQRPAPVAPVIRSQPRPVAAAPVVRSDPRPVTAAPVIRAEPRREMRPAAPAARNMNVPAATRQASQGSRRLEARDSGSSLRAAPTQPSVMRERNPAPRAAASVPSRAPRMESIRPNGGSGARAQSSGNSGRQQSGGRDNNRRS